MNTVHGSKKLECAQCDKRFSSAEDLLAHEELHCQKCGNEKEKRTITVESEEEVAEIFNKFFPEKVQTIEKSIPEYDIDPTERLREKLKGRNLHFSFTPVTVMQVIKAIRSSSRLALVV